MNCWISLPIGRNQSISATSSNSSQSNPITSSSSFCTSAASASCSSAVVVDGKLNPSSTGKSWRKLPRCFDRDQSVNLSNNSFYKPPPPPPPPSLLFLFSSPSKNGSHETDAFRLSATTMDAGDASSDPAFISKSHSIANAASSRGLLFASFIHSFYLFLPTFFG